MKNKVDWVGNENSVYKTLGASSHTNKHRPEHDYYATPPVAVKLLLNLEKFSPRILECACGEGHISRVLSDAGYTVLSTDLIDRGFGKSGIDFLSEKVTKWDGDIITNPPYNFAQEFVEKALSIVPTGNKVAMFLKLQFLEGKKRKRLFKYNPPFCVYVSSSRLLCGKNGKFSGSSAVAYCWFVWVKGSKTAPIIKWFN